MSKRNATTRRKFTRTPKIQELIECGVPLRAIPTYHALADHADNKTGKTFVSVEVVASILKVCRRTVERHLAALESAGVIRRQHQRRVRGRFSSCLCVVISFALFTVRHSEGHSKHPRRKAGSKRYVSTPKPPTREEAKAQRAARRKEGYEWLFT